jgi:hypothetical protein
MKSVPVALLAAQDPKCGTIVSKRTPSRLLEFDNRLIIVAVVESLHPPTEAQKQLHHLNGSSSHG